MARLKDFIPIEPAPPLVAYEGSATWYMLRVMPMSEVKAADRLKVGNLLVYLPTYSKQVRRRGRLHFHRLYAAISGMLFMPQEMLDVPHRRELFEFARIVDFVRVGADVAKLTKADIEMIRIMEAKLNLPQEAKGVLFKLGQQVNFTDPKYHANWGGGTIFAIDGPTRIGVEVPGLFGCGAKVWVPESEIEAL